METGRAAILIAVMAGLDPALPILETPCPPKRDPGSSGAKTALRAFCPGVTEKGLASNPIVERGRYVSEERRAVKVIFLTL
jgi:hypothetical protein